MRSIWLLLAIAHAGGAISAEEARRLYMRILVLPLVGLALLVLAGWGLNVEGHKSVNIGISLVLTVITAVVWLEPVRLAIVAVAGGIAAGLRGGRGAVVVGAENFLSGYVTILGHVLLWESLVFFILGTVPLGHDSMAIFGVIAALVLLALIGHVWGIGDDKWKKLVHMYVVVMLAIFALRLTPLDEWIGKSTEFLGTTSLTTLLATYWWAAALAIAAIYVIARRSSALVSSVLAAALALVVAFPLWNWATTPSAPKQPAAPAVLTMPANGKSTPLTVPVGHYASFTGSGFVARCVYTDGRDSIACESGSMLYVYVEDTTGRANSVTYKFVRP